MRIKRRHLAKAQWGAAVRLARYLGLPRVGDTRNTTEHAKLCERIGRLFDLLNGP